MIEIIISNSIISDAKRKITNVEINNELGKSKFGYNRKRIFEGYIGEKIVMDFLKINEDSDDYDYDLISKKGKKLEIKTISCKFKPKPHYWCAVNSHDLNGVHKQKADYYIFLRILNDYSKGWILGWISCTGFFKYGKFIRKGTDFGKFEFIRANATILPIGDLNQFNKNKR